MSERYYKLPVLQCSDRKTLDPANYSLIDVILKDLKLCSRRMQAALVSVREELRILERLYYKGKNQHRSALFWKRVTEIRRYGRRLADANVGEVLEHLRSSFYGANSLLDQKSMKGSWNHHPDLPYVLSIQGRMQSCYPLVSKMKERLLQNYSQFKLAMQTGAFIQLVLLLSAIAARLTTLMSELEDTTQTASSICGRVAQLLSGDRSPSTLGSSKTSEVSGESTISSNKNVTRNAVLEVQHDIQLEDIGDTIVRSIILQESDDIPAVFDAEQSTTLDIDIDPELPGRPTKWTWSDIHVPKDLPPVIVEPIISTNTENMLKANDSKQAPSVIEKRPKATKKKRDEIDAIFDHL